MNTSLRSKLQLFPLLRVAIVLIVGICLGDALCSIAQVAVWGWLFVGLTTLTFLSFILLKHKPMAQSMLLVLTIMACGCWRYEFCAGQLKMDYTPDEEYYEAVVASIPMEKAKTIKLTLLVTEGRLAGHHINAYFAKHLGAEKLIVGDGLQIVSRLDNPIMMGNVSSTHFDYHRWLQVHDILASTFVRANQWHSEVVSMKGLSLLQRDQIVFGRLRAQLLQRLSDCKLDISAHSIIAAMSLGDKTMLTDEQRENYSVAGVSHILALSGLHLGIIFSLLSMMLLRSRFVLWRMAMGNMFILLVIWGYAIMVGGQTSIMRSAIMFTIMSVSNLLRNNNVSLNTFGMALVIMLFDNPFCLWDVSFQMSFGAVFGILMCNERLRKRPTFDILQRHRLLRWCWSMTKVSVSAQIVVAPLVMYYFGRLSCYFLLANFVVIPLATGIVALSLLLFIVSPFGGLFNVLALGIEWLAMLMNRAVNFIASLPEASIDNIHINKFQLVILYVIMVALYVLSYYAEQFYRIEKGYGYKTYKP